MSVLVIAPHPDDEAIGCGGTLRLHSDRGDKVGVVFLTSGELGLEKLDPVEARRIRETEAEAAAPILGIAWQKFLRLPDWYLGDHIEAASDSLVLLLESKPPELIYLPHPSDAHPDHRASMLIVSAALKKISQQPVLRGYEIWTPLQSFDQIEDISSTIAIKLRAVRTYRSQLTEFRYDRAARGLAAYRGAIAAQTRFAEVFQTRFVSASG